MTSSSISVQITESLTSDSAKNLAEELYGDKEKLDSFNLTLLEHLAIQLFYNQEYGYRIVPVSREVPINGGVVTLGEIGVAVNVLIRLYGIAFYESLNERIQSKTAMTGAFNFPALQLVGLLQDETVNSAAVELLKDKANYERNVKNILLNLSNICVSLIEQGSRNNIDGFTGAKNLFPLDSTQEERIQLANLALTLPLSEEAN